MAKYIDKQAFLDHMERTSRYFTVKFDIENFPAADVAPVVRCKGCKHSWEDIGGLCCGYGPLVDSIVPEDFFCTYGKPKEG